MYHAFFCVFFFIIFILDKDIMFVLYSFRSLGNTGEEANLVTVGRIYLYFVIQFYLVKSSFRIINNNEYEIREFLF